MYRDGTEALRDIDLHIERDEFTFITGPSGAGKSTLLGLVYRDIVPTAGKVVVDGQDVAKLRPGRVPYLRRKVGVVFQEFQLLPRKTVWENVGFALDVVGASRREKYHKVPISLELVGLTEKAHAFPHQLSAGQRQRVSIARALVKGPPILLADEPTGNLDPDTSWEIVQLLLNINQQNTTVVVSSCTDTSCATPRKAASTMRLNTVGFLLQEGWAAAVRNGLVTLAAISNTAVALLILGGLVLVGINVEHIAALQAQAAVITVELAEDADRGEVEKALWANPLVSDVKFVSKEEALRQTAERVGLDAELLQTNTGDEPIFANPLPDSFTVRTVNPQDIPQVAREAGQVVGVAKVRYAQQLTEKLLVLARGIKISGVVVGVLLALATLMVISTTIRLTIYARRQEIRIMQLVGATNWFIRVPFIIEGILDGLAGGALAAAILLPLYSYVEEYVGHNLQFVDLIYSTEALLLFGLGLVLCGILFGAAGSLMGLHRYVRPA